MQQKCVVFSLVFAVLCLFAQGAEAYDFSFEDSTGKTHTLSGYKGKWVLINFWATWCPPCLREIPDLSELSRERNDIVIIGIAMEYDDARDVLKFVDKMTIPYPVVLGDRASVAQLGDEISLLPSTYLYDPQGRPAARKIGLITRTEIENFIGKAR
ncbi:MAG: TlpA family protein disulfide reductase [Nitrosomonas sp.]|nr:TlpA family protein disulfide reductase [Nitrosomonas sp.]